MGRDVHLVVRPVGSYALLPEDFEEELLRAWNQSPSLGMEKLGRRTFTPSTRFHGSIKSKTLEVCQVVKFAQSFLTTKYPHRTFFVSTEDGGESSDAADHPLAHFLIGPENNGKLRTGLLLQAIAKLEPVSEKSFSLVFAVVNEHFVEF